MADRQSAEKKILISLETDFQKAQREAEALAKGMREAKLAALELRAGGDQAKLGLIAQRKALDEARDAAKANAEALRNTRSALDGQAAAAHRAAKAEIDAYKQREEGRKQLLKGFADVKAAYDAVSGAAKKFGEWIDRGDKYGDMMSRNKISIDEASSSLDGLITNYDLLEASGHATQAGLQMTGDQLATLSKAAALAAKTMGTDEKQALEGLIDATSRLQPKMLKQYGIALDLKDANKEWAASHGTTVAQMSDADKKAAALAEVLDQLKRNTDGLADGLNPLDDGFDRLKNKLQDTSDEFSKGVQESGPFKAAMFALNDIITDVGIGAGILKTNFEKARDAIKDTRLEASYWAAGTDAAIKKVMSSEWDKEFEENLEKQDDRIKAIRDKRWKQDRGDRERQGKEAIRQQNEDFRNQTSSLKKWAEENWRVEEQSRDMNARADQQWRLVQLRHDADFRRKLDAANKATAKAEAKRRKEEAAAAEEKRKQYEQVAGAILSTSISEIAAAKSATEAMQALAVAGIKAISDLAIKMAAKEIALALSALAGVFTAPKAAAHFAAAAAWGALAGGTAIAAGALGSSGGGGGGSSSSSGSPTYQVQTIGGGSTSELRSGPETVVSINVRGASGLTTRKDLERFAARLGQGRA